MVLVFGMNSDDLKLKGWGDGGEDHAEQEVFLFLGLHHRGGTDTYLTTMGVLHDSTQDSVFVWAQCLKSERPTVVNSLGRRGGHTAVRRLRQ